jgi:hypothetical protein
MHRTHAVLVWLCLLPVRILQAHIITPIHMLTFAALRDSGLPGAGEEAAKLEPGPTNSDASLHHQQLEYEHLCHTVIIEPLRDTFPNLIELFEEDNGQLMDLIQSAITDYIEALNKDNSEEAGRKGTTEVNNTGEQVNSSETEHARQSAAEDDGNPGATDDVISPGTREWRKRLSDAMGRELQGRGKGDEVTYRTTTYKQSPKEKKIADALMKKKKG